MFILSATGLDERNILTDTDGDRMNILLSPVLRCYSVYSQQRESNAMLYKMAEFEAVHDMGGSYYENNSGVCVAGWCEDSCSSELPSESADYFIIWRHNEHDEVVNTETFTAGRLCEYVKCVSEYMKRVLK